MGIRVLRARGRCVDSGEAGPGLQVGDADFEGVVLEMLGTAVSGSLFVSNARDPLTASALGGLEHSLLLANARGERFVLAMWFTCSAEHAGPSWRRIAARSGVFTAAAISVGAAPFLGEGQRQLGLVQAADASALKRFGDYALDDKIASIPCFMITNSGGSPYLKTTNEGNQQVIIFMDIRDAEAHLGEVRARARARHAPAARVRRAKL